MAIRRFFYVTQDSLAVWKRDRNSLSEEISFLSNDEGFRLFSAYLERSAMQRSLMLVDVIEEEFDTDTIPDLSSADRRSLIKRRLGKRFARTPYRLGRFQGKSRRATDRFNVIYSAITNQELVDPWLDIIAERKSPLVGIASVPLTGADFLRHFRKPAENALLLSRHQGGRLRQIFIKSGQAVSARLSRVRPADADEPGTSLGSEIAQSRKYLERSRLLSHTDSLDVYLIADNDFAEQAIGADTQAEFELHVIDAESAATQLGIDGDVHGTSLEILFLAHCARSRPRDNYLPMEHTNYSRLLSARHALIGLASAGAIACSAAAGIYLTEGYMLRKASSDIELQITRLEETYRRENEEFEPIRADSHEMKLAVDTGEYILRNTLPVDWVMQEVGLVMGDHPDMHISGLRWAIETAAEPDDRNQRRGVNDRPMPVPIPEIAAVTANLSGEIRPYDGDLRHAFARIDSLASSLQDETRFDRVAVLEYPIDARPAASVSGEIRRKGDNPVASFSLSMTLRVDDEVR